MNATPARAAVGRWFAAVLATALAACAGSGEPTAVPVGPPTDGLALTPTAVAPVATDAARGSTESGTDSGTLERQAPAAAAEAARRSVAGQRGVAENEVRVVSVEAVVWPDSSLGCPEPGQAYLQVLTPGYRVVLDVAGQQVTAHTDRGQPPRVARCARPAAPIGESNR